MTSIAALQMPETAMVLAAGLGTRMRPLTDDCPKPLLEVAGTPLIEYVLTRFTQAGVGKAVVNTHYRAEMVETYLQGRISPQISISREEGERLETGGAMVKAATMLGDNPIFCTNTDAILMDAEGFDSCSALARAWNADEMDALLLLCDPVMATGYDGKGDFVMTEEGVVRWPAQQDHDLLVFTGLQILHPRLFKEEPLRKVSTRAFWDKAMAEGRLRGIVHDGLWMHVGDPAGLREAEAILSGE